MKNFNDKGLFRFSLIAPVINNTHGFDTNEAYFKSISNQKHLFDGKEYTFSVSCLKNWYKNYKNIGYTSLSNKIRSDNKKSRKLDNDIISKIISLREEFPNITGTKIYQKLLDEKYFSSPNISKDTILRYLRMNNLKSSSVSNIEKRMFEMEMLMIAGNQILLVDHI